MIKNIKTFIGVLMIASCIPLLMSSYGFFVKGEFLSYFLCGLYCELTVFPIAVIFIIGVKMLPESKKSK